jgi:hypothetical protein
MERDVAAKVAEGGRREVHVPLVCKFEYVRRDEKIRQMKFIDRQARG